MQRAELLDRIAIFFGGREAELAVVGDLSLGAAHDLQQATLMARAAVERYGMSDDVVVRDFDASAEAGLSEAARSKLDAAVDALLQSQRKRAAELVATHRGALLALRDALLQHKVVDRKTLTALRNEA